MVEIFSDLKKKSSHFQPYHQPQIERPYFSTKVFAVDINSLQYLWPKDHRHNNSLFVGYAMYQSKGKRKGKQTTDSQWSSIRCIIVCFVHSGNKMYIQIT